MKLLFSPLKTVAFVHSIFHAVTLVRQLDDVHPKNKHYLHLLEGFLYTLTTGTLYLLEHALYLLMKDQSWCRKKYATNIATQYILYCCKQWCMLFHEMLQLPDDSNAFSGNTYTILLPTINIMYNSPFLLWKLHVAIMCSSPAMYMRVVFFLNLCRPQPSLTRAHNAIMSAYA